ncbi:hypothetical protein DFP72DRAFT_1107027 [Ephemerocybe angulata]|uniref:Uncharacterized protein n=1 Tax=Ephemerocybe angulata TaxID=980116 RepID=A0A8H6I5T2_9AGAR|nr:hypothetical protein DFP72DRAFT_1107027 [Tulosesus angulatus]
MASILAAGRSPYLRSQQLSSVQPIIATLSWKGREGSFLNDGFSGYFLRDTHFIIENSSRGSVNEQAKAQIKLVILHHLHEEMDVLIRHVPCAMPWRRWLSPGNYGLIDKDTPKDAYTRTSYHFSKEILQEGVEKGVETASALPTSANRLM